MLLTLQFYIFDIEDISLDKFGPLFGAPIHNTDVNPNRHGYLFSKVFQEKTVMREQTK